MIAVDGAVAPATAAAKLSVPILDSSTVAIRFKSTGIRFDIVNSFVAARATRGERALLLAILFDSAGFRFDEADVRTAA